MASGSDVRRRPDLWSYISFSNPSSRVASQENLSYSNNYHDPHEKPDRHLRSRTHANSLSMSESQMPRKSASRSRMLKIAAVFVAAVVVFLLLIPGRNDVRPSFGSEGGQKVTDAAAATGKCSESYSPEKPLIQYVMMIDAGSTGSRIHVYRFNNCGPTPELENEVFEMTKRVEGGSSGLSSFDSDAEGAAKSLDILMDVALESVPKSYQGCSPVAVKATAGLRKLGEVKSEKILKAVRTRLENKYPFPVLDDAHGGVQVMDGKDEGVYAWITANYLLGKIGGPDEIPTAGVFDLGGGSTQIVFQPSFPHDPNGGMPETLEEGDHKYKLDFGGRNFSLYQHSYLGYGLMEARNSMHQLVADAAAESSGSDNSWTQQPVINPCIPPETSKIVDVTIDGKTISLNMTGPASGGTTQCRALAEKALKKESECKLKPCAFNGVYQPSLSQTFAKEEILLLSFFYDRTQPLGMPETFTIGELRDLTGKVCAGPSGWNVFQNIEGALDELNELPETCLDLNFMLTLLNKGYEMPMDRDVRVAKKIGQNELGWCLGASLPLLEKESGWKCRITQVE